jgi:hypothetical protein
MNLMSVIYLFRKLPQPPSPRAPPRANPISSQKIPWLAHLHPGLEGTLGIGIDARIVLECVLSEQWPRKWTGVIWLMMGTAGGLLSDGNEYFSFNGSQ